MAMSSSPSGAPSANDSLGSHVGPFPRPGSAKPAPDYSGIWEADDGGWYFLRQIGLDLWWVGVSDFAHLCPGSEFCNVYHASVSGLDIDGDWSDVPRGATSNSGRLTLAVVNDDTLSKVSDTGGFGANNWYRTDTPWPVIAVLEDAFKLTLKNVVGNWDFTEKQSLFENLQPLKGPVTVFAWITDDEAIFNEFDSNHTEGQPVYATYPDDSDIPKQSFTYDDFMCLNDQSWTLGFGSQNDCDASFMMATDTDQLAQRQPFFFDGIEGVDTATIDLIKNSLISGYGPYGFEAEILMFGRDQGCREDPRPPIFPGWGESEGGTVLFNGQPINIVDFVAEISVNDPVRVCGALAFDHGHDPHKLEIHPVYSVDKMTATSYSAGNNLSGGWADDVGNTYYLRHDPNDNAVWYVGLSPLGSAAFGQVFCGTFYPAGANRYPALEDKPQEAVSESFEMPAGIYGLPMPPQNVLMGEMVAIDLGWGIAAEFDVSRTQLGYTGPVTFEFGETGIPGAVPADIPKLSMGDFRLIKLYDA
jgi:hypothetical protein